MSFPAVSTTFWDRACERGVYLCNWTSLSTFSKTAAGWQCWHWQRLRWKPHFRPCNEDACSRNVPNTVSACLLGKGQASRTALFASPFQCSCWRGGKLGRQSEMCRIFYPISKHDGERVSGSRISGCGTQANNRRTWALSHVPTAGILKRGRRILLVSETGVIICFQPRQICSPIPIAGFLPSDSLAICTPFYASPHQQFAWPS